MDIRKALVWLVLFSGNALAYQENFTLADGLDFSDDVVGTWVLDSLSNMLGFLPVFVVFLLFTLIIIILSKSSKGLRWFLK